jgi:hypothetical protein
VAYRALVIPVMIASPGDVASERDIVRSVIHDWNDVNASASKVVLSPIGWETHSSPELGARPQELINSRLLKECDLLVGVFWTRLGTPTGKAESGTVEELEEHVAAGKPAMIYFSSQPVAPQSIDAAQFAELQAFKEKLKPLGLVESFDNLGQFREKFAKQLQLCLINNPYLQRIVNDQSTVQNVELAEVEQGSLDLHLSEEARTLLKAAAEKEDGTILKIAYMGKRMIQAGGQQFGGERGRESAKWENALNNLIENDLVLAQGSKDQVFELTHHGWSVANAL